MDELAKKFADLAEKYGPNVVDATLRATTVEGYSMLISSIIWIAFAIMTFLVAKFAIPKRPKDLLDLPILMTVGYCSAGISAICAGIALWIWIDPWTWVAISHPELYLAKKVFKL